MLLVKTWKFIFSGIILMMTISHIAAVLTVIQPYQPFEQMRDIRRHGQDVALTLTIDCSLEDQYLRQIAQDLKPFGRMRLRINHECGGDWFTHNQRFSYQEVGDFFVRFAKIVKEEAPQISVVFCGSAVGDISVEDAPVQFEKSSKKLLQLQISGRMTAIWHCITDTSLTYVKRAVTAML